MIGWFAFLWISLFFFLSFFIFFFFLIFTSDKDVFFSPGNVTIHAWLIKEEMPGEAHPGGRGEEDLF